MDGASQNNDEGPVLFVVDDDVVVAGVDVGMDQNRLANVMRWRERSESRSLGTLRSLVTSSSFLLLWLMFVGLIVVSGVSG